MRAHDIDNIGKLFAGDPHKRNPMAVICTEIKHLDCFAAKRDHIRARPRHRCRRLARRLHVLNASPVGYQRRPRILEHLPAGCMVRVLMVLEQIFDRLVGDLTDCRQDRLGSAFVDRIGDDHPASVIMNQVR
jgi:hypothetical protein